jgi:hypothetical protein
MCSYLSAAFFCLVGCTCSMTTFLDFCRQLSGEATDYSHRQELSTLVTLYVDSVRDIMEQSQCEGDEHLFISKLQNTLTAREH